MHQRVGRCIRESWHDWLALAQILCGSTNAVDFWRLRLGRNRATGCILPKRFPESDRFVVRFPSGFL
jgi:hypothetical protein